MSTVALAKCGSYEPVEVNSAVAQCLNRLGGISQFIKTGQKVLVKPNVLMISDPARAIITHPSIIHAVVKEVVGAGATALVGDSPGNAFGNVEKAMEKTGIKQAVESAGGKMVYFQQDGTVELQSIRLAKIITEVDAIINIPKLKTHNLTLYTGAIKNLFGLVPGFYKAQFHAKAIHPEDFAELMVNILDIVRPTLNIMDAVLAMEGPGPSTGGRPRKMGLIAASADAVALDAVGSYLIGFQPQQIDMIRSANKRGMGESSLEKLEIIGEDIHRFRQADWRHPMTTYTVTKYLPRFVLALARPLLRQLKINPRINQQKCRQCLVCLKNCPVQTIHQNITTKEISIDLNHCINCFCCHELCPYKAVDLEKSWLVKLMGLEE